MGSWLPCHVVCGLSGPADLTLHLSGAVHSWTPDPTSPACPVTGRIFPAHTCMVTQFQCGSTPPPSPGSSVLGVAGRVLGASMVILGSFLSSSDYTLTQAS